MKQLTIGPTEQGSITVTVLGYERPPVGEFYDDNWLRCEVSVRAGEQVVTQRPFTPKPHFP